MKSSCPPGCCGEDGRIGSSLPMRLHSSASAGTGGSLLGLLYPLLGRRARLPLVRSVRSPRRPVFVVDRVRDIRYTPVLFYWLWPAVLRPASRHLRVFHLVQPHRDRLPQFTFIILRRSVWENR